MLLTSRWLPLNGQYTLEFRTSPTIRKITPPQLKMEPSIISLDNTNVQYINTNVSPHFIVLSTCPRFIVLSTFIHIPQQYPFTTIQYHIKMTQSMCISLAFALFKTHGWCSHSLLFHPNTYHYDQTKTCCLATFRPNMATLLPMKKITATQNFL